MLIRILAQNPGESFTRNFDAKFIDTYAQLLKLQQDPSVQQIARETLSGLQRDVPTLKGVDRLVALKKTTVGYGPSGNARPRPNIDHRTSSYNRSRRLPKPQELVQRISEARESAALLMQLLTTTPHAEVLNGNELITEFTDRCKAAQRDMQQIMDCTDPTPPDPDTFQTLIETSEQLALALSKHQRALLAARRELSPQVSRNDGQAGGDSSQLTEAEQMAMLNVHDEDQWHVDQRRPDNEYNEAEAGGSRHLTEAEQLARLNVHDEAAWRDGDGQSDNDPFADADGAGQGRDYPTYRTDDRRNKGKQAYVSPVESHIEEMPILPPRPPQSNGQDEYGFTPPTLAPALPTSAKPHRPPPPAATATEFLNNAYNPTPTTNMPAYPAPDFPPYSQAHEIDDSSTIPPPGPPLGRAELPAEHTYASTTNGAPADDTWNNTRSHWANVSSSVKQAPSTSPPPPPPSSHPRSLATVHENSTQHSQASQPTFSSTPSYLGRRDAAVQNITMSGANLDSTPSSGQNDNLDSSYPASVPKHSTPQRRPPPVPKVRLTRQNLEGVDGSDGNDSGGNWGEESFIHYSGGDRRVRDV